MKKSYLRLLALIALSMAIGCSTLTFAADGAASVQTLVSAASSAESAALSVISAPAPVPNKGDTAWMMIATIIVIIMAIPGLALFYGGMVRSKNMLSILMQVFTIFAVIIVLWCVYGYSLAFTEGGRFFGSFDRVLLKGIWNPVTASFSTAATFRKGVVLPEFVFVVFQGSFAAITCGIIVGSFAERAKFSAVMLFSILWFTFSYVPLAHMVWFWTGPDMIKDAATLASEGAKAGYVFQKGALDFAGGTVVHINSAIAGLVGAYVIGQRLGYRKESMAPHSLTMSMVGASLLWAGWFGFNAGSALEANDIAVLAFVNTLIAAAAATVSWLAGEWVLKGKPSMLGAMSGAIAGLVVITPACGLVGPGGALVLGTTGGLVCLWGVNGLKRLLRADDSLDVFGVHGVGGIAGALLTGVFAAPSLGGQGLFDYVTNKASTEAYSILSQVWIQAQAVGITLVWSGTVAFVSYKLVDKLIGLRISEEQERAGLDISSHGESAYHS